MIDWTKLGAEWGYEPQVFGPQGPTPAGKTSITKKPTTTTTNTGGTTVGNTFQYPSEWGTAGDTWSQVAKGNYSNTGMQWLNDWLGKGGAQGMFSGWADAYKPAMMDDWTNMTKEMAERAGVGGTRYSSGLQNSITNYGSQLMNQFNRDYMGNMLGAGQSDVGAAGNLAGLGLGAAQTGTEGLLSLGGQTFKANVAPV